MSKEKPAASKTATRRKFLTGAALATAAVSAPNVVKAQGAINMRFQSTWPSKDIFHEYALDYAKTVNDMTGGDLKIDVLPAGAVVPAFGLIDRGSKGTLDGGQELLAKLYASLGLNVVSFPYGPMATQPLGWFKKPVTSVDDFKGVKYRTVGISIDMFTAMGAAVNALPGGEIVSAMDRGLLHAAEFNPASPGRLLCIAFLS